MNDEEFDLIETDPMEVDVNTDFWWRYHRANWDNHRSSTFEGDL
jgi:hypothetical protein